MSNYMILAVPMTEWTWLDDILDPDTQLPTGRKRREYGIFWDYVQNNILTSNITPPFQRIIDENPRIMIKDGVEWGIVIMPVSRFTAADYDAWATAKLTDITLAGITIIAATVERNQKQQWFTDNGLTNPGEV